MPDEHEEKLNITASGAQYVLGKAKEAKEYVLVLDLFSRNACYRTNEK